MDAEQSGTPLQVGGDVNLAEAANIETKGSSAPLLTGSESFAAGLSCPNVNERSSEDTNLLQSEAKTHGQAATPIIQADVHSLGAGGNDSSVGESKSEEKCQREANPPLQTSGHSLAVDASSSSVSGSSSEGKSQEAKEDGESDQIVPS